MSRVRLGLDRWTCDRCGAVEEWPYNDGHAPETWASFAIGVSFGPPGPDSHRIPTLEGDACPTCAHLIRTLWLRKDKP